MSKILLVDDEINVLNALQRALLQMFREAPPRRQIVGPLATGCSMLPSGASRVAVWWARPWRTSAGQRVCPGQRCIATSPVGRR